MTKFMEYLNDSGATKVITDWLSNASKQLSDIFKGGDVDLSAKNLEKIDDYLDRTLDDITEQIDNLTKKNHSNDWSNGGCFVAGTQVKTIDGHKNIEEIKVGDKVYAKNSETGEEGYKEVAEIFEKETTTLVYLQIGDELIITTENHPFWINGEGFKAAGEIRKDDEVVTATGEVKKITDITIKHLIKPVKVYNFEVADWHTYYVSESEVLVHNKCSPKGNNKNEYKKPISGKTGKEAANDVPSWAKGNRPKTNENGKDFAKRLLDEKYGVGNYPTGPGTEYNKIRKWGDRGFEK